MKKIILLALAILMMVGCRVSIETDQKPRYDIIILDSCEYVYNVYGLAHKGNCRFCKERRQKEVKELIEQLSK